MRTRPLRHHPASLALVALAFGFGGPAPSVARAADAALVSRLKSKDVAERLAAIGELSENGAPDAEALLLDALRDDDWEVVVRAATALGARGGAAGADALAGLALDGPARRIRVAAARAAGRLDAERSAERFADRAGGKSAEVACEALVALVQSLESPSAATLDTVRKGVEKGLKSDESAVRKAAARGLAYLPPAVASQRIAKLVYEKDVGVAAAAIDGARAHPRAELVEPLLAALREDRLLDLLERRIASALRAAVALAPDADAAAAAAQPLADALARASAPAEAARVARAIGLLAAPREPAATDATEPAPSLVPVRFALAALEPALRHGDPAVRAAGAAALGRFDAQEAVDRLAALATADAHPRARLHALRAVTALRPAPDAATVELCVARLGDDDAAVRECAAVALGARGADAAVPALERALDDKDWSVAVCAAVSLGKTRSPDALAGLRALVARSKDWRLRGAAVVGLGRVQQKEAVPDLIAALSDKEPAVARSAFEFLRRLTSDEVAPQEKAWRAWWAANGADYVFLDREEEARKAAKYGYAPDTSGVYEGLDVVVLQSRGDTIEKLLERLAIGYRLTRQAAVPEAGLHPFAIFVANCTGEVRPDDIERLQWFVRVGGYVFCSCWALHHTAELVYPGPMRKLEVLGEVLDNVEAESCPTESGYLEDVFEGGTRPIYVLYGSHLIEVLDPERVEVLIDSPDCATRWGGGNLAAWFDAGHGVVLDSSNHFDLQGLEKAEGLKSADDRRAFAVDHMGIGWEDLRKLDAERVWKSGSKAAKAARDLSAFRFITNFVREKRRRDP